MIGLEAAKLKKAHLLRFGLEISRLSAAELPDTRTVGEFVPIRRRLLQRTLNLGGAEAALPKIHTNSNRALALIDTGSNKTVGKPLVALQPLCREVHDGLLRNDALIALVGEFSDELSLPVLATGQDIHRLFPVRALMRHVISSVRGAENA